MAPDDRLKVIDLDTYHRGPFIDANRTDLRSDRFMAPEEHLLGPVIDRARPSSRLRESSQASGPGWTEDL